MDLCPLFSFLSLVTASLGPAYSRSLFFFWQRAWSPSLCVCQALSLKHFFIAKLSLASSQNIYHQLQLLSPHRLPDSLFSLLVRTCSFFLSVATTAASLSFNTLHHWPFLLAFPRVCQLLGLFPFAPSGPGPGFKALYQGTSKVHTDRFISCLSWSCPSNIGFGQFFFSRCTFMPVCGKSHTNINANGVRQTVAGNKYLRPGTFFLLFLFFCFE